MSNITHGMDVASIQRVADSLERQSDALSNIRFNTDRLVSDTLHMWQGPDVRQFAAKWDQHTRRQVAQLSDLLRDLAKTARDNVQAQQDVSDDLDNAPISLYGHSKGGAIAFQKAKNSKVPESINHEHHVLDRLDMAEAAYRGGEQYVPDGWKKLSTSELKKLGLSSKDLHDPVTGFDADIYLRPDGQLTVTFRGTEDLLSVKGARGFFGNQKANPDTYTNSQYKGVSDQDKNTRNLVHKLSENMARNGYDLKKLDFVGHSLGGRHALIAGIMTGSAAMAVNPSNVSEEAYSWAKKNRVKEASPLQSDRNNKKLTIMRTDNDPVSSLTRNAIPDKYVDTLSVKGPRNILKAPKLISLEDLNPVMGEKLQPVADILSYGTIDSAHVLPDLYVLKKAHDIESVRKGFINHQKSIGRGSELKQAEAYRAGGF